STIRPRDERTTPPGRTPSASPAEQTSTPWLPAPDGLQLLLVVPIAPFAYAVETSAARGSGQDRARVFENRDGLVIALADGAGGTRNGAIAAQAIVDAVGAAPLDSDWPRLLSALDRDGARLGHGQ